MTGATTIVGRLLSRGLVHENHASENIMTSTTSCSSRRTIKMKQQSSGGSSSSVSRVLLSLYMLLLSLAATCSSASPFLVGTYHGGNPKRCFLPTFKSQRSIKSRNHPSIVTVASMTSSGSSSDQEGAVTKLLQLVSDEAVKSNQAIRESITQLSVGSNDKTEMDELLGYYNVSSIIPVKETDRPVGGKWNAFQLQESFQHVVPAAEGASTLSGSVNSTIVAQVINLVTLRVLCWTVTVLLRGDAYQLSASERQEITATNQAKATGSGTDTDYLLSPRTVRADFDPPRIFLGKWLGFSIGPTSSVVLDTPYCDDRIRIGKGSKGTLFVFQRTPMDDDSYVTLLKRKLVKKQTLLSIFGSIAGLALTASIQLRRRWMALFLPIATLSGLCTVGIALSTGGIVQDRKPQ